MGNYTELFYHFIWATRQRTPMIDEEMEPLLHGFLHEKCKTLRVAVHALNGMQDHMHIACTLPTSVSIADFMEAIKGASSYFINQNPLVAENNSRCLYWQTGYGAMTFSKKDLPWVTAYIENQKLHHLSGKSLSLKMETIEDDYHKAPKGVTNL